MKIKEFSIIRYGPLPNTGRILLHNFNLFFGKNEDGKTLTIDALVKLLLGRGVKDFEHIERVEETPEGYLVIEDDQGKEVKLSEKVSLTKVAGLTPSECGNIFIIRNSALSIASESEFYTDLTDRLTGLRTKKLSKVKEALLEVGEITPGGIFQDIKDKKLKTRIESGDRLIEKIENLSQKVKEERFDELEEELVRQREKTEKIGQKIENLEDARKREKYEKGKEVLNKLKEALERLKELECYNENDEQLWRDCERDIQNYNKEKEGRLTALKENEGELKKTSEKLREKERDFQVFDERKKRLDDEVNLEVKNYEIKSRELAVQEKKSEFFASLGITSAILFGVSLLGVIVRPSLPFYILASLLLILILVLWIFKFQFVREKTRLAGAFEKIKLTLARFELSAETIEGVLSNIQKFEENHRQLADEIQETKRRKEILENKIEELREKTIPDKEKKVKDSEEKIDGIKRKSRAELWEDYSRGLKLRQEYKKLLGEERSVLESRFGTGGRTVEENIPYWVGKIKDLEEYKDKAKGVEDDENIASKLKEERDSSEERQNELGDKMENFRKSLEEIEREANKILQLSADYLHCKTSVDLDAVRSKLQEFINENKSNKENVLKVIEIFEEIETEEREKISQLFGKGSSVSKYFKEITDGLYQEVLFNQERGKIEVRGKDEVILEAEKLSGGAYDQLYLSIRLALGEKLLKGKQGFFIMDDPFIKADLGRLQRQIEMLKKISQSGWQVIYFSAKGEVKDALKEDIKKGTIDYLEIPSIFP
ncbi:MAG: hypothetical protein COS84_08395 [Armatimonadetes bacterium CG07_land_8_20_14_0_80_40_9]|nr:MAG: hypothetical protein COS84_08395 [Armatimonadetes bacterium CG07_land_8_20_14_0_80_40_9]